MKRKEEKKEKGSGRTRRCKSRVAVDQLLESYQSHRRKLLEHYIFAKDYQMLEQ